MVYGIHENCKNTCIERMHVHVERRLPTVGAAPPEAPAQPRPPPHQDEEADPVLPVSAKMDSQNGAPSSFFLFDTRLKFLDDAGLKIPHGYECPLRRLWLRPTYEEIPAELTFRALSRPKWRGCGLQANLRGFSPPTTPAPWRGVAYGAGLHACSASIYWLLTKFLLCMR